MSFFLLCHLRCWLVKYENPGCMQNRPCNLDHLFLSRPQASDHHCRVDVETELLEKLLCGYIYTAQSVDELFLTEEKILGYCHGGHQASLLKHHRNTRRQGIERCAQIDGLAVDQHFS